MPVNTDCTELAIWLNPMCANIKEDRRDIIVYKYIGEARSIPEMESKIM